ncbi:ABC transporter ATP-binding protein [Tenggerimyces flavus]|uniref:ABC transporter ATP-binding protein n=1 Tax=Tenggerimyces flavus TaxID=1708749 RepID=A0ABV7Y6J6_9ACTN|nr:ABC transporter ATP-binding protein [Tenggerimyces flavus]MBM7785086.1 ATP-binding cassette subfamily B protein [Tenggerimyces flavus]
MPETRPPVSRYRAARTMLSFAWAADRRRTILSFGLLGLEALAGSVFALWLKLLLDGQLGLGAVGMAASIGGVAALSYTGSRVQATLQDRAKHLVQLRMLDLMGRTPTLEIHEDPRHLAQLEAFRLEGHAFANVFPSLIQAFATVVRIVTTSLLLVSVHPLLLALPLFGAPMLLLSPMTSGLFYVGVLRASVPQRRSEHLLELTATPGGAKEVRLFRLRAELLARFHATHREIRHIHHSMQVRAGLIGLAARVLFLVGYVAAIAFVVDRAVRGEATVGDAALTAVLAGQVLGLVTGSAEVLQTGLKALVAASRWVYLHDVFTRARERIDPRAVVPSRLTEGIRFEGVSYRYPLAGSDALHEVDLLLPAGATVAVVGDNGAGKSTLVKLLAGMYLPTSGRLTVDGVDLAEVDPDHWRLRLSAGFQDHARFEFVVRETVGIGDLPSVDDADTVAGALGRAGAVDLLQSLPDGLNTQLGTAWDGGVDLSGGQWQKLALARAMMRTSPLLLLLDEPTAALDADTEHQLFDHWTAAARQLQQSTGAITLLVSHRFSTVRMADLIVVVDSSRVVEVGTHAELMARGGLYAELFELQARSYR